MTKFAGCPSLYCALRASGHVHSLSVQVSNCRPAAVSSDSSAQSPIKDAGTPSSSSVDLGRHARLRVMQQVAGARKLFSAPR